MYGSTVLVCYHIYIDVYIYIYIYIYIYRCRKYIYIYIYRCIYADHQRPGDIFCKPRIVAQGYQIAMDY